MPHTIKQFEEGKLVTVAFDGLVEGRTLLTAIEEIEQIAAAGALPRLIWDSRSTACLAVGPSQLDRVITRAAGMSDRLGAGRTAFVVARGVDNDLAAMFIAMTHESPRERSIFSEMDAALAWLFERAAPGVDREAPIASETLEDRRATARHVRMEGE